MNGKRLSGTDFETAIECHFLQNGFVYLASEGLDCELTIFFETVLAFIRNTSLSIRPNLTNYATRQNIRLAFSKNASPRSSSWR